jgi:hypothetical protein
MSRNLVFTFFFVLGSFFSLSAQELSIVGGLNFSNMIDKDDDYNYAKEDNYKSRLGGHVGLLLGFDLSENISLQTGLMLSTKGYKIVDKEDGEKIVVTSKLNYLDIPLLASYNYEINDDFKIYAGLGPVLGLAISGKEVIKGKDSDTGEKAKEIEKFTFGSNEERDDYKRLDVGLMIQAGVRYDKYKFGLFFNQGLLNISNYTEDGSKEKNKVFGISAAYVIDLKK